LGTLIQPTPIMPSTPLTAPLRRLLIALACLSSVGLARAETPPMKAGLWEVTRGNQTLNGQAMPDPSAQMAAQLKNMPPQMRKQMEAQMKAHGVQMNTGSSGTGVRMCITPEMLANNQWQKAENGCSTASMSHTGSTWSWKVKCTQPPGEGEGTTSFSGNEAYTTKMHMTMVQEGQKQVMDMTMSGKWISADCGGLKPVGAAVKK
jgi:hypothetical protein